MARETIGARLAASLATDLAECSTAHVLPTQDDPPTHEASLHDFLAAYGLERLADRLRDDALCDLVRLLFEDGRPAFLSRMSQRGFSVSDRQALANALNRASRSGYDGVAESEAQLHELTAWLDRPPVEGDTAGSAWEPRGCPFLVFTSAGDANNVPHWVRSRSAASDWELCVVYYGSREDPECLRVADRGMRSAGGKFPNLLRAVRSQLRYFRSFEAILVADDDVLIEAGAISRLFHVRRALDAWVLQP